MRDNLTGIIVVVLVIFLLFVFGLSFKFPGITGNAVTGEVIARGGLKGLELSVIVPEKYQTVQAGEMLQFQVALKNIQKAGRHDIQLDHYIKKNEIVIMHRRELKAVETQASFLSSIKVPEETLPGIYNVEVEINEEENALDTFYVKSSEMGQIKNYLILLIVSIVVVGGLVSWEIHWVVKKQMQLIASK